MLPKCPFPFWYWQLGVHLVETRFELCLLISVLIRSAFWSWDYSLGYIDSVYCRVPQQPPPFWRPNVLVPINAPCPSPEIHVHCNSCVCHNHAHVVSVLFVVMAARSCTVAYRLRVLGWCCGCFRLPIMGVPWECDMVYIISPYGGYWSSSVGQLPSWRVV